MLFYYPPSSQAGPAAALWWSEPETPARWHSTSSDCDVTAAAAAASQRNFKPPLSHGRTCTRGMLTAGTSCARNLPLLRAPLGNSKRSKHIQNCAHMHSSWWRETMNVPSTGGGWGGVLVPSVAQRQKTKLQEERVGRSSALTQIG